MMQEKEPDRAKGSYDTLILDFDRLLSLNNV